MARFTRRLQAAILINTGGGGTGGSGSWYSTCVGYGYPDMNSDGVGDCAYRTSDNHVFAKENPAFQLALKNAGVAPKGAQSYPKSTRSSGDIIYTGPFVYNPVVSGVQTYAIEFSLEGTNQDCVMSPIISWGPSSPYTWAPAGAKNSYVESNSTVCIIGLVYQ